MFVRLALASMLLSHTVRAEQPRPEAKSWSDPRVSHETSPPRPVRVGGTARNPEASLKQTSDPDEWTKRLKKLITAPFVDEDLYREELLAGSLPPDKKPKLDALFGDLESHSTLIEKESKTLGGSCDVPFRKIGFKGDRSDRLDATANRLRILWEVARQRVNASKGDLFKTPQDYYFAIRDEFLNFFEEPKADEKPSEEKETGAGEKRKKKADADEVEDADSIAKSKKRLEFVRAFAQLMSLGPENLFSVLRQQEIGASIAQRDCKNALARNLALRVFESPQVKKLVKLANISPQTAIIALYGHNLAAERGITLATADDSAKRLALIVAKFPKLNVQAQLGIAETLQEHFDAYAIAKTPPVVAEPRNASPAGRVWANAIILRMALAREVHRRTKNEIDPKSDPSVDERRVLKILEEFPGSLGIEKEQSMLVYGLAESFGREMDRVAKLRDFARKDNQDPPEAELVEKVKPVIGGLKKFAGEKLRPVWSADEKLEFELVNELACGTGDWEETVKLAEKAGRKESGKEDDDKTDLCGRPKTPALAPNLASPHKFLQPKNEVGGGFGVSSSGGGTAGPVFEFPPGPANNAVAGGATGGGGGPASAELDSPAARLIRQNDFASRYGMSGGFWTPGLGFAPPVGGESRVRLDGGGRGLELGSDGDSGPLRTPTPEAAGLRQSSAPPPQDRTVVAAPPVTTRAVTEAPTGPNPTMVLVGPVMPTPRATSTPRPDPRDTSTPTPPAPGVTRTAATETDAPSAAVQAMSSPTSTATPTPPVEAVNFDLGGSGPHVLVNGVRVPVDPKTGEPLTGGPLAAGRRPASTTVGNGSTVAFASSALSGAAPAVSGQGLGTINNSYVSYGGGTGTGTTGGFGSPYSVDAIKLELNKATGLGKSTLPPEANPSKRRGGPGSESGGPSVSYPGGSAVDAPYTFQWLQARPIYDPKNYKNLLWYESDRWRTAEKTQQQAFDTDRVSVAEARGDERTVKTNPLTGADRLPLIESVTYLDKSGNVRGQAEFRKSKDGEDELVRVAELHPDDVGKGQDAKKTVKRRTERRKKKDGSTVVVTVEFDEEYPGGGRTPIVKNKKVTTTTQSRGGPRVTELVEDLVEAGVVVGTRTTTTTEGADVTVVVRRRNRTTGEEVVQTVTTRDRGRIRLWKPDEKI